MMLRLTFPALLALCVALGAVCEARVGVETIRADLHHHVSIQKGWAIGDRAHPKKLIELMIAVRQRNVDRLERELIAVSDPDSPRYGQWLSHSDVHELVAPSEESVEAVLEWLASHNVVGEAVTPNSDFIAALVTVDKAEQLLGAPYHVYKHRLSKETITRLHVNSSYTVPSAVAPHIDFITPTHTFHRPHHLPTKRADVDSNGEVVPDFIRSLYNISNAMGEGTRVNNTQAVASFIGQHYNTKDLETFWDHYNLPHAPFANVPENQDMGEGTEALLDVQYISTTGVNISTEHWYTKGEQPGNPENEPFIKWLSNISSTRVVPNLFSVSYGDDEDGVSFEYAQRSNVEFQKTGARGVTLLFASGDSGMGCSLHGGVPSFPASSPWITAVGGTKDGSPGSQPTGEVTAALSGGGFSNYYPRPSYQDDAVANYKKQDHLPRASHWNATGRAYPDIAAQAVDFIICEGGRFSPVSGTSCACPSAAGVIGMLNQDRIKAKKSALGFLNIMLYKLGAQNTAAFNDITSGKNNYCGVPDGFPATPGWDAATGWGTPNYGLLRTHVLSL